MHKQPGPVHLGDDRIVELWASKFRDLFTSTDPHAPEHLTEKLSVLDITSYDLETLEISPGAVLDSIKKLKRDKSDGGDLGVCQGGVLSPILFTPYIDDLLKELSHSNVRCYWENIFVGALAYADDLTLLAPSPSALRKLLAICKKSGSDLRLT